MPNTKNVVWRNTSFIYWIFTEFTEAINAAETVISPHVASLSSKTLISRLLVSPTKHVRLSVTADRPIQSNLNGLHGFVQHDPAA